MHAAEGIRAGPGRPATWGVVEQVLQNIPLACLQTVLLQTCHTLTPAGRVHLLALSSGKGTEGKCSPGEGATEFKSAQEAVLFTRHSTGWSMEIAPWSQGFIHNEARETTEPLSARQLGGSLGLSNEISPLTRVGTSQSLH